MKQNLLFILNLLTISLFVCSAIIFDKEPLFAIFGILWSTYYFVKSNKHLMKIKSFTLIELIAVITIVSILMSIIFSIKTDTLKCDAQYINSLLLSSQTYSYSNKGIKLFEITGKVYNQVELRSDKDIYFKDGTPVNSDGSIYLDCYVLIYDKNNPDSNYKITINSFTGKRSFY